MTDEYVEYAFERLGLRQLTSEATELAEFPHFGDVFFGVSWNAKILPEQTGIVLVGEIVRTNDPDEPVYVDVGLDAPVFAVEKEGGRPILRRMWAKRTPKLYKAVQKGIGGTPRQVDEFIRKIEQLLTQASVVHGLPDKIDLGDHGQLILPFGESWSDWQSRGGTQKKNRTTLEDRILRLIQSAQRPTMRTVRDRVLSRKQSRVL